MPTIDWFVPDRLRDDLRTRRKARVLVGSALGLALVFLIGTAARLAIAEVPPVSIAISAAGCALLLAVPFLLRATASLHIAGYLAVASLVAVDVGLVCFVGGLEAPLVMVFPLLPFVATVLLDARAGTVVGLLLCGVVLLFALAPLGGFDFPPPPRGRAAVMAAALVLLLAIPLMVFITTYFERQREEVEQRLQDMLAELSAKNTELERFTFTVSHDLKSPLITLRSFLRFLKNDAAAGDREKMASDIDHMQRATRQMQHLVDDLLELSRIGRRMRTWVEVPLAAVVRETVELLSGRIAERGVEIEIAPDLPAVQGDRMLLRTVFQNLIDNAVKFTAQQAAPRVRIGVRHGEGETVYFVADNGVGIRPEDREKVFGLFEQLNPAAGGTGIGLTTVQRAIEAHGGRVWVESEGESRGSTFCFTLAPKA